MHQRYGTQWDTVAVPLILKGDFDFQGSQPSVYMRRMLREFSLRGIRCGLLSATPMRVVVESKYRWVLRNYDLTPKNFDNWCVVSSNTKVVILELLAQAYDLDKSQVLLVDDTWSGLAEAQEYGFMACSPSEVVNYFVHVDEDNKEGHTC